jgi:hypothetical protein
MIVRSNSRTARIVLSAGALTLATVIFGLSASAKPKFNGHGWCVSRCQLGQQWCFQACDTIYPKKKASISPARRPVTGTGASTRPTHLHR